MTINLMSRRVVKWQKLSSHRRRLEVDDFDKALSIYESPLHIDIEVELSEMPKPKYTRMVELQVESRGKAKFESRPIDIYPDIEN
jgi:hypothetical protein